MVFLVDAESCLQDITTDPLKSRRGWSFKLLFIAVWRITAARDNQRHHDNADNAEQLLHRSSSISKSLRVIVGSAYSTRDFIKKIS
jgi:hypothetical protein